MPRRSAKAKPNPVDAGLIEANRELLAAWRELRDEVLHDAEGHGPDIVNHYLDLIDSHDPSTPDGTPDSEMP